MSSEINIISSLEIDSIVKKTMKVFNVPGMAVAIIKDNNIIHSKGYGVTTIRKKNKVNKKTLFAIASNSKAFTCTALAILVDEKKIKWDDKVKKHIPEFRMYHDYVTEDFTIRDLVTHRSGLGLGAGNLMLFPNSPKFTITEIIDRLKYLKQMSPLRSKFDYDNLLYLVAGEIVKRVAGIKWEEFIEKRIFKELFMKRSFSSYDRIKDKKNIVDGHLLIDDKLTVGRDIKKDGLNAAGGIYSSLEDMCRWLILLMNKGKYGENLENQLFSMQNHKEMWSPQTILPVTENKYNTNFMAYGLGWFLLDICGLKKVTHTGGVKGMVSQVSIFPQLNLGIVVLVNQQVPEAFLSITNSIQDSYLGLQKEDWISKLEIALSNEKKSAEKMSIDVWNKVNKINKNKIDYNLFVGKYKDNWFDEIEIEWIKDKLWFKAKRSSKLKGEMTFFKKHTFIIKWLDRSINADAFAEFEIGNAGKAIKMKMKAISPLTDLSFNFQDLFFTRIA